MNQRTHSSDQPLLVVIPSVAAARQGDRLFLDDKAISGLGLYKEYWSGRVRGIFRECSPDAITFGSWHNPESLPFEIATVPENGPVPDAMLWDSAMVLASGDNYLDFAVTEQCRRLGIPLVFTIEYTLRTRLKIISLSDAALFKRAKSMAWTLKIELERRRAFRHANGLQANGTPANASYTRLNPEVLMYFDTRLSKKQIATNEEVAEKQAHILSGSPLRLAFTGRLETMKGADDLIRIAIELDRRGKDFRLEIYGAGSLEADMRRELNSSTAMLSLRRKVKIFAPIDFVRELMPMMRSETDLFLCCHRQADPSCTYLETLGCAVPILGYNNDAWRGILDLAHVGWWAQMDRPNDMVEQLIDLDANRPKLATIIHRAREFGAAHCFEIEFEKRVDQLRRLAKIS